MSMTKWIGVLVFGVLLWSGVQAGKSFMKTAEEKQAALMNAFAPAAGRPERALPAEDCEGGLCPISESPANR